MKQSKFFLYLSLISAVLMWSSEYVGIRQALHSFTPGALALLRYLIASSLMVIVYVSLPKRRALKLSQILFIFMLGSVGIAGYNLGLIHGEITVPAGTASFMVSQMPIIMALLGFYVLDEHMTKQALIGMIAGFLGIVLISLSGIHQLSFEKGLLYIFLATLGACIYSVLQKPWLREFSALEFTCLVIWGGTLAMLVYLPDVCHEIAHASRSDLGLIMYLGLFPAAIAYIIWANAIKHLPVSTAGAFLYISPLMTILFAWFSLHELPNVLSLIGGLIALGGAIVVGYYQSLDNPVTASKEL